MYHFFVFQPRETNLHGIRVKKLMFYECNVLLEKLCSIFSLENIFLRLLEKESSLKSIINLFFCLRLRKEIRY